MRERTGQIIENKETNEWVARICYKNTNGKRTAIQRKAKNKVDAKKILKQLLETLEKGGREAIEIEKLTFDDLLDYYEKHYARPAKFIDNRKVEGLRDLKRVKGFIKQFRYYFGKMKLLQIRRFRLRIRFIL